ncbi:MAG: hypothetical protein ACRDTE_12500 [Pseudonocardiaceae bacterium]
MDEGKFARRIFGSASEARSDLLQFLDNFESSHPGEGHAKTARALWASGKPRQLVACSPSPPIYAFAVFGVREGETMGQAGVDFFEEWQARTTHSSDPYEKLQFLDTINNNVGRPTIW